MNKKVYVGLSGGVDSAVSAALLKSAGYDVTGVFIKIWQPTFLECTWERDRLDAMRVAVALGIPFEEIDLSREYEASVISDLIHSYQSGITPNPDVVCNERIKFGSFYDWARGRGADYVATGHYARAERRGGEYALLRGVDVEKDQSYFLYRIDREHLPHVLFPVGNLKKTDVRRIAATYDLPVKGKHDSQGLCFVGEVSMAEFLQRYIPVRRGPVVDTRGLRIGEHEGAPLYTIGQRHGFTVEAGGKKAAPHFVTRIDVAANTLVVSSERKDCERTRAALEEPHLLGDLSYPVHVRVQSRYREVPYAATIQKSQEGYEAMFGMPRVVSPGQSLVWYSGEQCLGGARIR